MIDRETLRPPDYWFPAKRYGWGWGLPRKWQGWAVLFLYVALLAVCGWFFRPPTPLAASIVYLTVVTGGVLAVCWIKGEPLNWRWRRE